MPETAARPVTLIDIDYGDGGLVVTRHPDGMLVLDLNDQRVVLTLDAFDELAGAFQLARFRAQELAADAKAAQAVSTP